MKLLISLALTLTLATAAFAQTYTNISVLGGATTRFTGAILTVPAASRALSTPALRQDIATVLSKAGLAGLATQVNDVITAGRFEAAAIPRGTTMEWMAFRDGGQPNVKRNLRWDGGALAGYSFTVVNGGTSYTFFIPEVCGNLSLLRHEAVPALPVPDVRVVQAPAPPAEVITRTVEVPKIVYVPTVAPEVATPRYKAYVAGFIGLARKQYDSNDPAGEATMANPIVNSGDPLIGGKFGLNGYLSEHWVVSPSVGGVWNRHENARSGAFVDGTLGYKFAQGTTLAGGVSLWDVTRHDSMSLAYLGTIAIPFPKDSAWKHFSAVGEFRQFGQPLFGKFTDPDLNYEFNGGLSIGF